MFPRDASSLLQIQLLYDLLQPKMSPTLSFSGIDQKPFIYQRNITNIKNGIEFIYQYDHSDRKFFYS